MIMSYILIAIIVCVIIFAKMALVIIPQSETKIVERLGRYYATLQPGINMIIPFIDRAKSIVVLNHGRYQYSTTIDLREQVYDFPKQLMKKCVFEMHDLVETKHKVVDGKRRTYQERTPLATYGISQAEPDPEPDPDDDGD